MGLNDGFANGFDEFKLWMKFLGLTRERIDRIGDRYWNLMLRKLIIFIYKYYVLIIVRVGVDSLLCVKYYDKYVWCIVFLYVIR